MLSHPGHVLFAIVAALPAAVNIPAAENQPVAPQIAQFVVVPDEPSTLAWQMKSPPVEQRRCGVYDYSGQLLTRLPVRIVEDRLEVTVRLPRGYYELEVPEGGSRFGLVALEPPSPDLPPDPFFAVDAAMSWLVGDAARRTELIEVLRRTGIGMSRERLSWSQIHPTAGDWRWETDRQYETLRQAYAQRGIAVLEMFHDAPRWLGSVGKYPDDLVAASRDWRQIARRWQAHWKALEIWNEPDIFFGANLPADQYVAVVRAVAYAASQQAPELPVAGGVFAHDNAEFLENAALNGLLDLVDVASFHTYGRAPEMEPLVARYRGWLQKHDRGQLPLWITECGRPWRRGPSRPPADQDAVSALDIVMKAVEARACGIERYFAFVYPFYEENEWNFGMTARDGTPLRSLAAYAQLARVLANKQYVGDLPVAGDVLQRTRVFAGGGQTVAVLYTGQPAEARTAELNVPVTRVEGIDGRELTAGQQVTVADGLVYVWLDPRGPDERLIRDTAAAGLNPRGRSQRPAAPAPIVLRYDFDPQLVEPQSQGYRLKQPAEQPLNLAVRAFNLCSQPRAVTVSVRSGETPAAGAESPGGREVTIPAESSRDLQWELDLSGPIAAAGQCRVTVTAQGEDTGTVPLVLDFRGEASLEQVLQQWPRRRPIDVANLSVWTDNVVGHARSQLACSPAGDWQMEVEFGSGDRWAYPIFRLPDDVDLSRWSGLVVRARCQRPAIVRIMLREPRDAIYLTPQTIIPADDQWHTAVIRFASLAPSGANAPDSNARLDLDQVRQLSIGINSQAAENRLQVSNVFLIGN